LYDVPAVIGYILEQTGSPKLHYVSHSVGSKNFMAGLSLKPEYNEKVGGWGHDGAGWLY
jgi:lysosomal acid lipase/cholesteryl ester hydrolase